MNQEQIISTAENCQGFSLTIYNKNFAVIREKREISLQEGINYVCYEDVSATIEPTSISFKSITDPSGVIVREQNYQYDLINQQTILDKSIYKLVRFRKVNPDGNIEVVEGILLNAQELIIRLDNGKFLLNPSGEIEVEEMPEGLMTRPSLLWTLEAKNESNHLTEVSDLANQISWESDYVEVISEDEKQVDLTGWVTLDNKSGTNYTNAQLQLIAGDVRRIQPERRKPIIYEDNELWARPSGPEPQFEEESFLEYHLYTLEGNTTIRDKETKQITLLTATDVSVNRKLIFDNSGQWWRAYNRKVDPGQGSNTEKGKVNVILEIANTKDNNMGIPLPKGKVKFYQADKRGNLQFLGEDILDHTPRNEVIPLYIGDSFDVVGDRKVTEVKQISNRMKKESYEISIRNRKTEPITIHIIERLSGDWEIRRSSHQYQKIDAMTVEFIVTIDKNHEVNVTYTAHYRYDN